MKTTQEKAVNAYGALNRMAQKPMNSFTAYKLFKLKKALQDPTDFQIEQEKKMVAELGGTVTETGQVVLDEENKRKFNEQRKELNAMECEIDRGKTEIYLAEIKDITLAEMEALEDFIEWKEK